ncbi:unnamed protein product [Auanema sp. JU1783]|nr:unnamed protein product [Auanema sp. JU1783]
MDSSSQAIKKLTARIEAIERMLKVSNSSETNETALNTINMELKRNLVNDEISIRGSSISKNTEIELNCTEEYKLLTELEASSTLLQKSLRTILLLGGNNQAFRKETEYLSSLSHEFIENVVDIFQIADSCSNFSLLPNRIRTSDDSVAQTNDVDVPTAIEMDD